MMTKLATAQRKAVSLIDPKVRTDNLFCKYKILKLTELDDFELCKLGYKLCHGLLPNRLAENMTTDHKQQSIEKVHKYPTRNKKVPNLPQALGAKYRSSFLYTCIKAYGDLDNTSRHATSLSAFARSCKHRYFSCR